MVQAALDKLFTENYFSICQLDSVLRVMGQPQGSDAYKLLHALHCVHYAAMPADLRQRIPHLVNECLRPPEPAPLVATEVALRGIEI